VAAEVDVDGLLATIRAVGPEAAGHVEAAVAWEKLSALDAAELPRILAGMDGAGPLAANWIATAVQVIVERQQAHGGPLPAAALESLVLQRSHSPRGRQLAYEILLGVDPQAQQRLIPKMLDDPCLDFRREAVARLLTEAAKAAEAGDKDKARAVYRQAFAASLDIEQLQLVAQRLGKLGEKVDLARQLGYVVHWKLIGPFDNTGRKGFDAVYPPEHEVQPDAAYAGKTGEVRWVDFVSEDRLGKIDFFQPFGKLGEVVGYAMSEFTVPDRQEVEIRTSSVNATKLWLNGRLVNQRNVYHSGSAPDQYIDRVTLEPGRNVILMKVCQNEQTQEWAVQWNFQLRVCDLLGQAVLSADRDRP
jgi:hypothetical protein